MKNPMTTALVYDDSTCSLIAAYTSSPNHICRSIMSPKIVMTHHLPAEGPCSHLILFSTSPFFAGLTQTCQIKHSTPRCSLTLFVMSRTEIPYSRLALRLSNLQRREMTMPMRAIQTGAILPIGAQIIRLRPDHLNGLGNGSFSRYLQQVCLKTT